MYIIFNRVQEIFPTFIWNVLLVYEMLQVVVIMCQRESIKILLSKALKTISALHCNFATMSEYFNLHLLFGEVTTLLDWYPVELLQKFIAQNKSS